MISQPNDPNYLDRQVHKWITAADNYSKGKVAHDNLAKSLEADGLENTLSADPTEKSRLEARANFIDPMDSLGYERVLGTSNLLPINFLERGIAASKAVCRINIHQNNGRPDGFGTGFLISPSLLLTNNHVLPSHGHAMRSFAEFDFQLDEDFFPMPTHHFQLQPDRFFYSNIELDFTIVAISSQSRSGKALSDYKHIQLKETSGKAIPTESVTIIQHPSGAAKAIALRQNKILGRFNHFIHYETDTHPGSSGSPAFSDDWEVVALHHSGVPDKNANGKLLKKDGKIWRPGDSSDDIKWVANEGIRISSIFEHLKKQTHWSAEDFTALDELGTVSRTNLSEALQERSRPKVVNSAEDSKRTGLPAPPRITLAELHKRLAEDDLKEADIAPYFTLDQSNSSGLDPIFKLNTELVTLDGTQERESARLLNSANWVCKRSRHNAYKKRKTKNPKARRIISEGDSWFQYPFRLHDVVDHLMSDPDLAILSFGEAGDLLRDIVSKAEFLPAIREEQPEIFLISGGGNDLVGNGGLKRFLFEPKDSFDPHLLIRRPELDRFKFNLASDFNNLFRIVLGAKPDIKILCHGYSYPAPDNGPWLGKLMADLGINDDQVQMEITRILFDQINNVIEETAESFPQSVRYLNVRNVVPPHGWFDELHPQNPYFGNVAEVFREAIGKLL